MTTTTTDLFAELYGTEQPTEPLPPEVTRTARFTVPDDAEPLTRCYGAALMEALELLPDEQLCRLCVCARCQNPALPLRGQGVWLLTTKCEAEAAERWNRHVRCGRQPSAWLRCILRGDLFLPSELES